MLMHTTRRARRNRGNADRRGNITVLSVFVIVVMLGLVGFAVEVGLMSHRRTTLQNAVDSAALAAASTMSEGEPAMVAEAGYYLGNNGFTLIEESDDDLEVEYGEWDAEADEGERFTLVSEIDDADAIRIFATKSDQSLTFARFLGKSKHTITAEAIATKQGGPPRDIMLVIDCSGSMSGSMGGGLDRMDVTIAATQTLIGELNEQDRVGLTVYDWNMLTGYELEWRYSWRHGWYQVEVAQYRETGHLETEWAFEEGPTRDRVDELEPSLYASYTNIAGGMRAAFDFMEVNPRDEDDDEVEKIMVLLTDGQANRTEPADWWNATWPHYNASWDDDSATEGMRIQATRAYPSTAIPQGVKVYCVAIGMNQPIMEDISDNTDAIYQRIDSAEELISFFRQIGQGRGSTLVY